MRSVSRAGASGETGWGACRSVTVRVTPTAAWALPSRGRVGGTAAGTRGWRAPTRFVTHRPGFGEDGRPGPRVVGAVAGRAEVAACDLAGAGDHGREGRQPLLGRLVGGLHAGLVVEERRGLGDGRSGEDGEPDDRHVHEGAGRQEYTAPAHQARAPSGGVDEDRHGARGLRDGDVAGGCGRVAIVNANDHPAEARDGKSGLCPLCRHRVVLGISYSEQPDGRGEGATNMPGVLIHVQA